MDLEERKQYKFEWHQKNKERRNFKLAEKRQERREVFYNYKKTLKCEYCGFSHPAALDFHHRNPKEKEFAIANQVPYKPLEFILKEIEKCVVLCSNYHRIEHHDINRI